jgi:hypothetical protein
MAGAGAIPAAGFRAALIRRAAVMLDAASIARRDGTFEESARARQR